MGGLRVLITNVGLTTRTGTEVYVRDLANALLERGHTPVAYSTNLGELARELRNRTIPVVDNLDEISIRPDIIHGHHNTETMTALLHFQGVPAVYFIHDNLSPNDIPPRFPRILRYVAVDDTCRDRLVFENGIPEDRVRVLLNFVDLKRFKPRGPLPSRPRRALVFSHNPDHLQAVRQACATAGLTLDVVGQAGKNVSAEPEALLGDYDIVFAKARSAIEALAVGSAVILCDRAGVGPMVTTTELNQLRRFNFGHRTLRSPIDAGLLAKEIARYDPADAAEVSRRIRATAGLDAAIDELISLYHEVITEHGAAGAPSAEAEGRAAAAFLRRLSLSFNSQLSEERQKTAELDSLTLLRLRARILKTPVLGKLARLADKSFKAARR